MIEQPVDFLRVLEDEIAASRRENVDRCGHDALAWLTLPPVWTEELAAKVSFPESRLSRTEFIAECEKLGWCVRRPAGVTIRPEEAADLLLRVLDELVVTSADVSIRNQIVEAAVAAIEQIGTPSIRHDLSKRLLGMPGLTAETAARLRGIAEPDGSAIEPEPTEMARLLIAAGARQELGKLLGEVRAADLQRILATPAGIPPDLLGTALRRAVVECSPRVAAKLLATTAPQLSRELVPELSAALRERVTGERGADGILTNLAIALASAGDRKEALAISDRLADDRLRARALAVVAESTASGPDRERRLKSIVTTIAHVIVEGEGVDLAGAADAVTRLARAGALAAARPLIEVVHKGLSPGRMLPADVGALVSISVELRRAVGYTTDATRFAQAAVEAAQGLGDPVARAAGLARVLEVAQERQKELLDEALAAARAVVDANDRADALARLVPHARDRDHKLAEVVRELVASTRPIDPGQAFWAPDAARADILAELKVKGLPWLRRTANEIAGALLRVESPGLVPTAVRRWAILAATVAPKDEAGSKAGDALLNQVRPLLRSGDVAEALGWIEAGQRVLTLVRGTFETSHLVATLLVELEQRRSDDRRLLQRFLARKEQVAAFERLLQVPDGEEPWALHYLGHGGVGKTMMVRHIAAELAPAQGRIVARIDFDHLNPEFPLRRPGQLLLNLLEELEAYADAETRPLYEAASTFLRHQNWWRTGAHQRLAPAALSQAVQRFCTFVRALPPGVVLILDTCEELAKFQPSGAVLPQLDAAFQLLERIHKEVPSVRIVLAGRRPLASSVHGGRSLNPERSSAASLPAEKTYLDVCEVEGFSNAEARRYLRVMEGLTLPDDTVRELLARSPDKPEVPFYSGGQAKRGTSQHVPFDLAQYATILRDYPAYLAHNPRSETYVTYVRDRIVPRQGTSSRRLLPAVVLLRRFDRSMLAAADQRGHSVLDEAWQELATTEWISTHVDRDLKTTFLEVERAMLERLEAYYHAPDQRNEYEAARREAAGGLDSLVRNRPLDELTADLVDAALRCLPEDRAAALCDALALRVARDGSWMWAYNVLGRVLGVDGALADPRHLAAASATALYTTALAQINPAEDYRSQWTRIAQQAMQHPATSSTRWLQARAEILAKPADTARWRRAMQLVDELTAGADGDRGRAAWLVGTTLAAACGIVDTAAEHHLSTGAADWERAAGPLLDHKFGAQVSAVTAVLLARGFLLDGNAARARELFAHALADTDTEGPDSALESPTAAEAAVDGAVPRNPRDRVRLEALLAGMTEEIPDQWLWQAVAEVADADSDRLASLLLSGRLDQRPVSSGDLERIRDAVGKLPPPPAVIYAHRLVPPLRIALSRCWLALGRLSDARSALGGRTALTLEAEQQQLLAMARVEVSRRLRLPRTDTDPRAKLRDSLPLVQAIRVHEAAALLGEPPPAQPDLAGLPEEVHVWWRINPSLAGLAEEREVADAVDLAPDWARNRPLAQAAAILDAAELAYLRDGRLSEESHRDLTSWPLGAWYKQHPDRLEDVWRLALRAAALNEDPEAEVEGLGMKRKDALAGVPRPGRRRLAELALEEGELLALRLPERGACLLDAAARWFHDADDGVGCLIAYTAARLADWRARRPFQIQDLKEIYGDARRLGADLPDWPKLQRKVGRSVGAEFVPWRGNQAWEGWLRRLTWLIVWDGSTMRRELDPQSTDVPPELCRAKAPDSLERRLQSVVAPGSKKKLDAGYASNRLASRRKTVALGAGATLGGVLAALILYGFFARAVGTLPVLKMEPLRVGAYVCALLGIACYVLLFMATGPRNNSARVMIRSGQHKDAAEIAIVGVIGRRWPLRAKVTTTSSVVSLTGSTVLDSGETDVHRMLASITRPRHPLRVSLSVARGLAHVPWERWLASPLTEPPPLYMERSNPEYLGLPVELEQSEGTYWVLAPQRWQSLMLAALPAESAKSARGFPEASPQDVIIVVGTAVDTGAGRRLVVRQGRSAEDLIIEPDGAAAVAVNVVIVGEPGLTDSLPLAAESAAALRDCAADLVQAGVHLAIVVPSTSADKASAVLSALAPVLRPGVAATDRDRAVFAARRELASGDVVGFGYELTVMRRP
jgi:hypothetical protein